jgi:hypothetical protein
MTTRNGMWLRPIGYGAALIVSSTLLAACNLGAPPPNPAPLATTPPLIVTPLDVAPTEATQDPGVIVPTTPAPTAELLPSEKLGPIAIDGTAHRSTEPVTVKVTRGKSVSNVSCSWANQNSGATDALATPTSTPIDENTFQDTYTFTPDAAGTYSVNCTGVATTLSGQRPVSATGTPFAVEAKG